MASSLIFTQLSQKELALSGIHVWPQLAPDQAVDRFIFRRPELAYLLAKKRMLHRRKKEKMEIPSLMGVRYRRLYYEGGKTKNTAIQKFGHTINHDNAEKDVKEFLRDLRRILVRSLPDRPLMNCSVQLIFHDHGFRTDHILSWQEKWL